MEDKWEIDVIAEENEEEMKEVREKANKIGKCWKRILLEEFEKESMKETKLMRGEKGRDCVENHGWMIRAKKFLIVHLFPRPQEGTILMKVVACFQYFLVGIFVLFTQTVKREDEIRKAPSTEGQLEGKEFKRSFRFDVEIPKEDLHDFTDLCAWWPRMAIPHSYCPLCGREIYPTQENFYMLEFSYDSDFAEKRRMEGSELVVWHEGSLVPIPKPYGYWNDSTSSTHG